MYKTKIYCTIPGCRNWLMTTADHQTALLFGWKTWVLDPVNITEHSAVCRANHLSSETHANVPEIIRILQALPSDAVVMVAPYEKPGQTEARRRLNKDGA